jgi:hypothetical protein
MAPAIGSIWAALETVAKTLCSPSGRTPTLTVVKALSTRKPSFAADPGGGLRL